MIAALCLAESKGTCKDTTSVGAFAKKKAKKKKACKWKMMDVKQDLNIKLHFNGNILLLEICIKRAREFMQPATCNTVIKATYLLK